MLPQLFSDIADAVAIVAVHEKAQCVSALVVVSPQRSDFVAPAYVPSRNADVLMLERFDVETNGWYCRDDLAELECV